MNYLVQIQKVGLKKLINRQKIGKHLKSLG
jgi:hypothetical protein